MKRSGIRGTTYEDPLPGPWGHPTSTRKGRFPGFRPAACIRATGHAGELVARMKRSGIRGTTYEDPLPGPWGHPTSTRKGRFPGFRPAACIRATGHAGALVARMKRSAIRGTTYEDPPPGPWGHPTSTRKGRFPGFRPAACIRATGHAGALVARMTG